MERRKNDAAAKDAQILPSEEECAVGMEDKNYAATKDVQNKIREVECAEAMEQSANDTARNDV